jgi:hypothetical protein
MMCKASFCRSADVTAAVVGNSVTGIAGAFLGCVLYTVGFLTLGYGCMTVDQCLCIEH